MVHLTEQAKWQLAAPENDVVNIPVTGYTKIKAVVVKDGNICQRLLSIHTM